ncbi:MAG: enoyl-CoA hydratase/isomerase family protein, partial [Dehalococcoidia bacterium]|nr:enoyl-CoA hydratase/isomerase family protein [Dehalococcoidia bacterium]
MRHTPQDSVGVTRYGDGLLVRRDHGAVSLLTLNRPSRRNALDREMLVALGEALARMRTDDRVRAVILTGEGSAFCSGVDISEEGRRTFYQPPQQIER